MGLLSIIRKAKRNEREIRLLLVGLDNAGKTTVVKRICGEDISTVSPTLGFEIRTVEFEGFRLCIWDVGGQRSLRAYWRNYFESTDVLAWVVDSADARRMADCAQAGGRELQRLLQEERLAGATLLVLANKQDVAGALPPQRIQEVRATGTHSLSLAESRCWGFTTLAGGIGRPPAVTDVDRSLLALRTQRRKLEQMRSRLHTSIGDQVVAARQQVLTGQRSAALFTLKKKRLQEQQLERLDGWLLNVEEMLGNVESTIQQGNMMAALQQGNAALKQLQREVCLEDVERLMEETANAADHQARIQQLLGESWTGRDETAAEAELEELEEAAAAAELAQLPTPPPVSVRPELPGTAAAGEGALPDAVVDAALAAGAEAATMTRARLQVVEAGLFQHPCEGEAVCKLTNSMVPYFNAPIFLENKTQVGKVDEIFGQINSVMGDGIVATSYSKGDKFFIDPQKLLPLERFLPTTKAAGGARGGRGGGGGRGRGGFSGRGGGRGGGRGRGGGGFGGRGGGGRGGFGGRGGGGGRGGFRGRGRG
eukprot:scaffold8.g1573.t1